MRYNEVEKRCALKEKMDGRGKEVRCVSGLAMRKERASVGVEGGDI